MGIEAMVEYSGVSAPLRGSISRDDEGKPMQKPPHAFSQLELLILICVVAMAAAILLPMIMRARKMARRTVCKSNLKYLGLAINMYSNDHSRCYPTLGWDATPGSERTLGSLSLVFDGIVGDTRVFRCPSTNDDPTPLTVTTTLRPEMCSYGYDSQKQPRTAAEVAIMADRNANVGATKRNSTNHGNAGQNVLYYDGHVKWLETPNCGMNGDNIWHRGPSDALGASDSYVVQN